MCAVGRELLRRGHRVTLFQVRDFAEKAEREGVSYAPWGEAQFPAGTVAAMGAQLGQLEGLAGVRFSIACAERLVTMVCEEGPAAVQRAGVDFLIVDQNEPAAGSVAEHLQLPFASICTSLPINREPSIPPPFTGWAYRTDAVGKMRNAIGMWMADRLLTPMTGALNRFRKSWGLPRIESPNDSFSRLAQISQTVAEIDFPRRCLPTSFCYAGPFSQSDRGNVPFPFERLDGRPLIYASLGTLQNRQTRYFEMMAAACAGLDAQLVISLGNTAISLTGLPGSPVVVNYAPQLALLARAELAVTHAGTNTVLGALTFGVPMVAIPISHDQPATAARIAFANAGEVVTLKTLTVDRLRQAVKRVLTEASFRENARRIQRAIAAAGGVQRAGDLIEAAALRTVSPAPAKGEERAGG
jgi:zeaxanthin glucosyltransferase